MIRFYKPEKYIKMVKKKLNITEMPKQRLPGTPGVKQPDVISTGPEEPHVRNPLASLRADVVESNKTTLTPWAYAWIHAPRPPGWFVHTIHKSSKGHEEDEHVEHLTHYGCYAYCIEKYFKQRLGLFESLKKEDQKNQIQRFEIELAAIGVQALKQPAIIKLIHNINEKVTQLQDNAETWKMKREPSQEEAFFQWRTYFADQLIKTRK